ncbi:TetR family transcriptional regulator [Luteibacter aegosomatissinici]|uniref:TetR family transcriptional regulator n=1 Tax=Luteibacter aegosomatissinici TaxID=2911539 RepID=UPI001FF8D73C|nr:TetR family transcriptional regulator [Luteibacter aegosomatissinici]UPG92446.1 TetR family transcriptional regulator [Luteibacter aegosomatissinici]
MSNPQNPPISSRKQPKQARSTELVSAILEAAAQVLAKEGAARFTTARVADRAGVSVGSVYQYFPNKAAILFRLQSDEWRQTSDMLAATLADDGRPPFERLRRLVHAFIVSECDEAAMRVALDDAAPLYRDAPEARAAKASGERAFHTFMVEALPGATDETRSMAVRMVVATLSGVGKDFSSSPREPAEIASFSDAMADMFCAWLGDLQAGR